jgi:D-glycero-D-manno-heptose 1,7-bisphosphate phosphatase
MSNKLRPALFLDRDGVLLHNVDGFAAKRPEQLQLVDHAAQMLISARDKGYLLILVSNQPDEALGNISTTTRIAIEDKFVEMLLSEGLALDAIYYCYHHENSVDPRFQTVCDCRKPAPGLILAAATEHDIDLPSSYILGDRATDIKAGAVVGLKTILFDPDNSQQSFLRRHDVAPDFTLRTLVDLPAILSGQYL